MEPLVIMRARIEIAGLKDRVTHKEQKWRDCRSYPMMSLIRFASGELKIEMEAERDKQRRLQRHNF
jgi:hypothetical protein